MVPILRAGLVLLEQTATLLPVTQTYHVGYVRNDDTLEVGSRGGSRGWRRRRGRGGGAAALVPLRRSAARPRSPFLLACLSR